MRYFKVVARRGHCGSGKYLPINFAFVANDIIDAMDRAKSMPGVKHTQTVLSAKEITFQEYCLRRQTSAYAQFKPKEVGKQ